MQGAIEAEHLISARRRGRDKGSSWGSPTSPKKVSASHGSSAPSKGAAKGEGATETPSPEQLKQMIAHTYRNVGNMVDQSVDPIQVRLPSDALAVRCFCAHMLAQRRCRVPVALLLTEKKIV